MPPTDDWSWERYRAILVVRARVLKGRLDPRLQGDCDPSELVQETFLRAAKGLSMYKGGPTDVERLGWLREILGNYTIDWIRKVTKQGEDVRLNRYIQDGLADSLPGLADLVAKQSSPSQGAERNEEIARLCAALQLLPKKERMVIELHKLEGLSIKDTAERLGLKTPKSASGLFARGLLRLAKLLGGNM